MKILKEAKENLPVSFLTNFVSESWEKLGNLKDSKEAISKMYAGTKKVEDIMQDLIDAYYICISQLEKHLSDKDYLDVSDEAAEEVKETLKEDVEINIENVTITEPKVDVVETPETEETPVEISVPEIAEPETIDDVPERVKDDDAFEYFVDNFPDPVPEKDREDLDL